MARIFITGSADGIGQLAAKELIKLGHQVMLHARNEERGKQAMLHVPGAEGVLIGDLSSMKETKALAASVNDAGSFHAVIHNAGIYHVTEDSVGEDGLSLLFTVNTIAPYILTCLIQKPERLIYLSSDMHLQGDPTLENLPDGIGKKSHVTYSDTKLHDLILSMAVAEKWTDVYANAVNPGWVPTKMGGQGAPDSLEMGCQTQAWLAVSNEPEACVSGKYFHYKKQAKFLPAVNEADVQNKLLHHCEKVTGVRLQANVR